MCQDLLLIEANYIFLHCLGVIQVSADTKGRGFLLWFQNLFDRRRGVGFGDEF